MKTFLILTLDGSEGSASRPGHFALKEIDPGPYWREQPLPLLGVEHQSYSLIQGP
jgi:hypothetical protein